MKNTALNELITRLKNEAAQIEASVKANLRERDKYQDLLTHIEERLFDKRELIEFLEASAKEMDEPTWKKGDRFMLNFTNEYGEITGIDAGLVYVKTDAGAVASIGRGQFERQAVKS